MKFRFNGARITGLLTVILKNMRTFDEEMANYHAPVKRTKRLKMVMGFDRHHFVEDGVTSSDLALCGLKKLIDDGKLDKDTIDALVLVTQSPDYFMPPTSNVIAGKLGLRFDTYCLDVAQGCAGFIIGLQQAFLLLQQDDVKKVVLVNSDVISRKGSRLDRNSWPLAGDAASICIVEKDDDEPEIRSIVKMDGQRYDALIIPAGGFREPCSPETAKMEVDEDGNARSRDNLCMQGGAVFNFMQTEVPPLIEDMMAFAGTKKEDIDYWLFHQPNKFMVDKLADAIEVPHEKLFSNIVTYFGNASGVTIPTNICYNLGEKLLDNEYQVCLSGFGVGLTWGAMVMRLGRLDFCEMTEF